ncbi:MAG: hypothetical protein ACTSVI_12820 [Promethearchaeota archaeon]
MNKLGLLAGLILLPFLILTGIPMGNSTLPLYLLEDGDRMIAIYGTTVPGVGGLPSTTWWFMSFEFKDLLVGFITWFFPFISFIICMSGIKKSPKKGNRLYMAAFFLSLVVLILILMDAFFFGQFILTQKYGFIGFLSTIKVGFWIYCFDLIIMILAAKTYQEI